MVVRPRPRNKAPLKLQKLQLWDLTSKQLFRVGLRGSLSLVPSRAGVEGDGFLVQYLNAKYFVPEGQFLTLFADRQYKLQITRVLLTDRGLVADGEWKAVNVNTDKPEVLNDTLKDQIPNSTPYHSLIQPRIIANFKDGNIIVAVYRYMSPPQIVDDVMVEFAAFVRTSMPSIYVYGTPSEDGRISFQLPADTTYSEMHVSSRVRDTLNNRVILSTSAFVEFNQ